MAEDHGVQTREMALARARAGRVSGVAAGGAARHVEGGEGGWNGKERGVSRDKAIETEKRHVIFFFTMAKKLQRMK